MRNSPKNEQKKMMLNRHFYLEKSGKSARPAARPPRPISSNFKLCRSNFVLTTKHTVKLQKNSSNKNEVNWDF